MHVVTKIDVFWCRQPTKQTAIFQVNTIIYSVVSFGQLQYMYSMLKEIQCMYMCIVLIKNSVAKFVILKGYACDET